MKEPLELPRAVNELSNSSSYKVVTDYIISYREDLIKSLINTKADVLVIQGMVRSIDQVLSKIVKTK